MKRTLLVVVILVAVLAAVRSVVFVDQAEMVVVTQFGEPLATYVEAGPRLKYPWQSVIRIDRRLQVYDPRPSEFLAGEKKNLDLDVFVCWRVDEPLTFLKSANDPAGAEALMHDIVFSELSAEVGKRPMDAIVSIEEETHQLDAIVDAVTKACAERARTGYGIEIVDVKLKRIGLPEQIRENVFQRMRAERERMAQRYRAEGEEEAMKIRAEADKQQAVLLAEANEEAERIRGDAEAEAIRIYAEAHGRDPQFFEVQRKLEAYRKFLDDKTTVLLSADSDLLKYLTEEPRIEPPPAAAPTSPALVDKPVDTPGK